MIKRHLFSSLFALVILWLSFSNPGTFSGLSLPSIPHLDKFVHAGIYFIYTFLLFLENRDKITTPLQYLFLSAIPFFFGATIEVLQTLLTNFRSGEVLDVLFNTFGIGSALIFWLFIKRLFFRRG